MDTTEDISERGDEYAKRMLVRNRMSDRYSSSYRRRLSIIEAINKNLAPTSNLNYNGNPFEKEFSNSKKIQENDKSNVESETNLYDSVNTYEESNNMTSQTYNVNSRDSLLYKESIGPNDTNLDNQQYKLIEITKSERHPYRSSLTSQNDSTNEPRSSIGERFGPISQREMKMQSILNEKYEKEFEKYNAELQRQGLDEFFGARVIEIIEPVIVKYHGKDMDSVTSDKRLSDVTYIKENLEKVQLQNAEIESSASFGSEDMRKLDREIDKLQYDEVIYEDLKSPLERINTSEDSLLKVTKDLNMLDIQSSDSHLNGASTETLDVTDFRTNSKNKTFTSATPKSHQNDINNKTYHGDHNELKTTSFLKRHTSFLFKNLRTPKLKRRKSNKKSSPSPQGNDTFTLSSPDEEKPTTKFQRQIHRYQANMQPDLDDTMASEMESFLKSALGNGNRNSTMALDDTTVRDRSNSYSHSIEQKNSNKKLKRTSTFSPRKRSSTLNRTLTIYKTLSQRIKEKFRKNETQEAMNIVPSPALEYTIPNDVSSEVRKSILKIHEKINVQNTRIYQACKALELCDTMKEFTSSPERVEYERLLLIACLMKNALYDEITRLVRQGTNDQYNSCSERGEVTLKELRLQLREDLLRREGQNGNVIEWFVVVISHFTTIWATHAIACPISSPMLIFPGQFSISGLTPDFRLKIRVFSMKLQQEFYNHEDKYHIPKNLTSSGNSKQSKSPKIMKKKIISPKQHKVKFSGLRDSSFLLCGTVDFMLYDLKLPSPWPLSYLPSHSVLHGTIDVNLSCKLELAIFHAGFLTHCNETDDLAWNRRWCLLEGHTLLFWNYPREQEYRSPIYTIDLVNCVSSHIELIDRTLCARPRTLMLETTSRGNERDVIVVESKSASPIVRHLLSCDTNEDLTEWQSKLNHVIAALRDWNIIHTN